MPTSHDRPILLRLGVLALALGCGSSGDDTGAGTTADLSTGTPDATTSTTAAPTGDTTAAPTADPTSTPTTGDSTGGPTATGDPTTGGSTDDTAATADTSTGDVQPAMSFFVSSTGSPTADLGGLAGADQRCQDLADLVGAGDRTWRAYLSIEKGPDDGPVHARDRIGQGPWYNADLVMIAADLDDLHTKDGDHALFLDEFGDPVPGQWEGSPGPNEHDILTGTLADGTVAVGLTCADWTSADPGLFAQVGHSDGLGPNGSDAEQYRSWNSVHESGGCDDTAPKGGAGRIYCFAAD
jgi:hypothetical protein